jgi:hypothetical protein
MTDERIDRITHWMNFLKSLKYDEDNLETSLLEITMNFIGLENDIEWKNRNLKEELEKYKLREKYGVEQNQDLKWMVM